MDQTAILLALGVGGEEGEHGVGGVDLGREAIAGPGVVSALNGVDDDAGAVFTSGVRVGVNLAGDFALGIRCAAVVMHPEFHSVLDGCIGALRAHLEGRGTAVEGNEMVGGAVEDNHGDGFGGMAGDVERTFNGRDGGHFAGEFAAHTVGHHAAVGDSGDENAAAVDGVLVFEMVDECVEETDVVNTVFHGVGAAVA